MTQMAFFLDLNRCIGCETCTVACKSENNTEPKVNWRWVMEVNGGKYPTPTRYWVSVACNHCEEPACLKACPVDAITKDDDGIVLIDSVKCTGCKRCMWACPYGAPQFNGSIRKVEKCTMCRHRVDNGEQPACVATCVSEALQFGKLSDIEGYAGATDHIAGMPSASLTKPSIRFKDIK